MKQYQLTGDKNGITEKRLMINDWEDCRQTTAEENGIIWVKRLDWEVFSLKKESGWGDGKKLWREDNRERRQKRDFNWSSRDCLKIYLQWKSIETHTRERRFPHCSCSSRFLKLDHHLYQFCNTLTKLHSPLVTRLYRHRQFFNNIILMIWVLVSNIWGSCNGPRCPQQAHITMRVN